MELSNNRRRYMGPDVDPGYLRFTPQTNTQFMLTIPAQVTTSYLQYIEYSTDEGRSWVHVDNTDSKVIITVSVNASKSVLWRGEGSAMSTPRYSSIFSSNGYFIAEGSVLSLLFLDDVYKEDMTSGATQYAFSSLFSRCTKLRQAPELPSTKITISCYDGMFYGCTGLTTAPVLPATILDQGCYMGMFRGCTGLTTAPELPATTLAIDCYSRMFAECTGLTTAPELPATTLADSCYSDMFRGCTGLTTVPTLPATTLASYCYARMFYGCTSLNYIKAMFTTTPSTSYTEGWVYNVASSGTFVKNSSASWNLTGENGVPSGWTVQTASS